MGVSIASKRPVVEDLGRYFPATFELATMATILAVGIGLILGVTSARKYNQLSDHIGRAISIVGYLYASILAVIVIVESVLP